MSENPTSVMPDYKYQWDLKVLDSQHNTLIKRLPTGLEVRKGYYPTAGYPYFTGNTEFLDWSRRATMQNFINSVRGNLLPFYFFRTDHKNFYSLTVGSVTAQSSIIIPYKDIQGTLDEIPSLFIVTVAAVSKAFTITEGVGTYGQARINFTGGIQTGTVQITSAMRAMQVGRFDHQNDSAFQSFMANTSKLRTTFEIRIQGL